MVGDMSHSQVDPTPALGLLWGKSDAGGRMNLLIQHLLDAAATAEQIWDHFLAPTVTHKVDACCDGQGRPLFALLCGLHDVGKASPAFQAKVPELAAPLREIGLIWRELDRASQRWHHSWAGASVVRRALPAAGWHKGAVDWVWPLVAGHHGEIPSVGKIHEAPQNAQGVGAWVCVQDALVGRVAIELGIDLAMIAPSRPPRRAAQLTIAGLIIMADWIASDVRHFSGIDSLPEVSMTAARERAQELGWR